MEMISMLKHNVPLAVIISIAVGYITGCINLSYLIGKMK